MPHRASELVADRRAARAKANSWLGAIPIGIALVFLAWLGWRKWPDPLIDFGQQLYLPWRIAQGAVLYRDVQYLQGCLSVTYHALLFKTFGASLNVVLASNFLILGLLLTLVFRLFLKSADALTATGIGLALTVLALGQSLDNGNYNYITPYTHEAFHGIVLTVVMIAVLSRWLTTGGKLPLALAGGCLGLVWLTKPEIFLGATVPFVIAFIIRQRQVSVAELTKSFLLALGSSLIGLAGLFFYFQAETNTANALHTLLGAWLPFLHSPSLQNPFYQRVMGLDAPWFHIGQALLEFGGLASLVGLCAWRLTRPTLSDVERLVVFVAVGAVSINYVWQRTGHALPLLLVVAVILWWREWSAAAEQRPRLIFPALWLGFSFTLLAKLGINPRISHYGVFLAMPAFLSAFYLLLHLVPRFLERNAGPPKNFRLAMLIFLMTGLAHLVIHSSLFYRDKHFLLTSDGDQIFTYDPSVDPTGQAMSQTAAWIEAHTAPTNTLAVLPEGAMLNYLTRRINPTPYAVFTFEVWAFGEQTMLAAFQKNPPDYVVLIHESAAEYGHTYFGQQKDYGHNLMEWINQNYQPVWLVGGEPLQTNVFGIKILKVRQH